MADHPITQSPAHHLAEWLETRTNQQLKVIVQARADTAIPEPRDLQTLAHRLLLPASLARALEQRNALELAVVEALLTAGAHTRPVSQDQLLAALAGSQLENAHHTSDIFDDAGDTGDDRNASALAQALQQLQAHAIVLNYPPEKTPAAKSTQAAQYWLPARIQNLLSHRDRLLQQQSVSAETIAHLPDQHHEILRRIHAGGGLGTTKYADSTDPDHPITQMISAGVLYHVADSTVALPVSVARILSDLPSTDVHLLPSARIAGLLWHNNDEVLGRYQPDARYTAATSSSSTAAEQAATAAGLEACREVSNLLDYLGERPAPMLKNGGLGQRSTKTIAQRLGLSVRDIARTVAIAAAAGLIGTGEPKPLPAEGEGNYLAPTRRADDWQEADLSTRWSMLLRGWIDSPWPWWQIDDATEPHQRLLHAEFSHHRLAAYRRLALHAYARSSAQAAITDAEFWQDLLFLHPKLVTASTQSLFAPLVREAEWLGAINNGVLSSPAVALLVDEASPRTEHTTRSVGSSTASAEPDSNNAGATFHDAADPVIAATRALCPEPVSEFIVQADLTIMCPGPLEPAVRTELELLADVESSGLASLYRVDESSLRRSLDAGRSGAQIIEFLREHSLTPVPDAMLSVIRDLARHHGGLRGGPAVSYVRCEDPATLDVLEHSAAAAEIAIHRVAPTVVISQRPLAFVVQKLAQYGFYAVAEDSHGHGVDIRQSPARVPAPRNRPASSSRLDAERVTSIVDKLTIGTQPANTGTSAAEISNVIELAQRSGRTVVLGYATKNGQRKEVRATVLSIFGGNVDIRLSQAGAADSSAAANPTTNPTSSESIRRIPLHRIIDINHTD